MIVPLTLPSPLPNLLRADWGADVTMEVASSTSVVPGRSTAAEERRQLLSRPIRTLQVTLKGMTQEQALETWMNLISTADRRTIVPLYQDQALTTSSSTGQFINVVTELHRFFVGGRVVIYELNGEGNPTNAEYVRIVGVSGTQLDLGASVPDQLQEVHPAGAYVFPLMDVEVDLDASGGVLQTDEFFQVSASFIEVWGLSALPYLEDGLPADFDTEGGYPILAPSPDWSQQVTSALQRAGVSYSLGRGQVVIPLAERPQVQYDATWAGLSREDGWPLARFLESRAGRLRPFWLVAPQTLFTPVAITTGHVDVEIAGNIEDVQDFLDYVAIQLTDGSVIIRGITSVALTGGIWRLTFDAVITAPSLDDIRLVTSAHLVRLRQDSHEEHWSTDTAEAFKAACVDLLREAPHSAAGAEATPFDLGLIAEIPDLYLWGSSQGNAWVDLDGGGLSPSDPSDVFPDVSLESNSIDFLFDSRQSRIDNALTQPYLQRVGGGSSAPRSAYFKQHRHNNGLRTNYHFGVDTDIGWLLENSQAPFFSNTLGMTIFICGRFAGPRFDANPQRHFVRVGIFEWYVETTLGGQVRFYATADAVVSAANITYAQPLDSTLRIWAVRWNPGVSAAIYRNGGTPLASAATPAASLATTLRDTKVLEYRSGGFGPGDGLPQEIDFNLDRQSMTNEVLVFKRALSDDEMNVVGDQLAAMYALLWTPI